MESKVAKRALSYKVLLGSLIELMKFISFNPESIREKGCCPSYESNTT